MKKSFFVFAALILVTSAVVFAQELKFDGYLNSGFGFVSNDREGETANAGSYFKAFGVDSESNGYRFRLNGSFTNEAKNAGVRLRLQGQRNISLSGYLSMPYLYGWLSFFDNQLTLTGGLIMDSTWESADWWWNDDTGEGLGLLLKAVPIKGLNLGVGAYTISQQGGGRNNMLQYGGNSSGLPNLGNLYLKPQDMKYTFNAAYTIPDLIRFGAIYRTKNRAGWMTIPYVHDDDYDYTAKGGREETSFLQGEVRVLAVKDLTAVVVGTFENLEKFYGRGNIMFSETIGYKIGSINLGLNMFQYIYNRTDDSDNKVSMNPSLLFNPWVSYTIGKIVPRLDAVCLIGGQSKMGNGDNQWERRGFVQKAGEKDKDDDYTVASFRPSVKINLDSRIFLEIGDMFNIDLANFDGAYGDTVHANKKSLLSNVFYVDVKLSF